MRQGPNGESENTVMRRNELDVSVVIGVAGGSASGKTTVVSELVRQVGAERAAVLRHDAYYHDLSHMPLERRIEVNVDHPDSLETELLLEHVSLLRAGQPVEVPAYDFASQTRGPAGTAVHPAPILVIEGLFTLWDRRLRALMDLTAFVEATEAERLERRIERDRRERGRDRDAVVAWHERRVEPMHRRFVEPSRVHADVVIPGGGHNVEAVRALIERVRALTGS
jgi:uridine kinase